MNEPSKLIITPAAFEDLRAIHDYIAKDSQANAIVTVERIVADIDSVCEMPTRAAIVGRSRSRGSPVRGLVVQPYIVYYRIDLNPETIYVLRIRHAAQRRMRTFD